ncbi:DUF4259 domain-containing protein [Streptomyces sp. NPDC056491]|uniref:DUF4259 domain-containing protein n=1 Tax=Streptomyces sp. NPDC056491 TaxID=3345837 RepID=UPI0036B19DBA
MDDSETDAPSPKPWCRQGADGSGRPAVSHAGETCCSAAALVAAQCPGGRPVISGHGPDLPVPALPAGLRETAVRALDRITAGRSELRDLWMTSDRYLYRLHSLHLLRRCSPFRRRSRWPIPGPGSTRGCNDTPPPPTPCSRPRRSRRGRSRADGDGDTLSR